MPPEANAPVHVAFVVNNFPPRVGGVERHVASLASALVRAGHTATVVTLSETPSETTDDGVRVIRIPQWLPVAGILAFAHPGAARRIARDLAGVGVTAVSTHTRFFPLSFVGRAVARRLGVPLVHTEHGSGFVRGVSPVVGVASRLVDLSLGRAVLRSAAVVLAVSEEVQRFVERLSGVRARIFPNAIDESLWHAPEHPGPPRFVFVGRLVPGKGWDTFLAAVDMVRASRPDLPQAEVFGDGPQRAALAAEIARRGLERAVVPAGSVAPEALADRLGGAILVNPTELAEGFQTSLLEVLACGGQVVTYDVPGARLLAADGAPVWIVDDHDEAALATAMAAALDDPKPPYPRGRLRQWTWTARAREYAELVAGLGATPAA